MGLLEQGRHRQRVDFEAQFWLKFYVRLLKTALLVQSCRFEC